MSTPIKSSLLARTYLSPRSPRLLAPLDRNAHVPKARLSVPENGDDSFVLNTPHKKDLLKYGFKKNDLNYMIGKGAFGTVIKGQLKAGEKVAIKLVSLNSGTNYFRENNAKHLMHENIVRILDMMMSEEYAAIVMEYSQDCRNLQEILHDTNYVLSKNNVILYCLDIAKGLQYCHENGVLHLDIKPKNIVLSNNTCKICDFGNSLNELDAAKVFVHQGTPAYTAPEIFKGHKPSSKCDIYSFSMVLWQLMSRKNLYEFLENEVIIYKVVKFNLRPPLYFESPRLSNLCSLCWNENPESRLTATEVCDFLYNVK